MPTRKMVATRKLPTLSRRRRRHPRTAAAATRIVPSLIARRQVIDGGPSPRHGGQARVSEIVNATSVDLRTDQQPEPDTSPALGADAVAAQDWARSHRRA
jgi:hypothetical protein